MMGHKQKDKRQLYSLGSTSL